MASQAPLGQMIGLGILIVGGGTISLMLLEQVVKHPILLVVPIPTYVLYKLIERSCMNSASSNSIRNPKQLSNISSKSQLFLKSDKVQKLASQTLDGKTEITSKEETENRRRYESESITNSMADPITFELMKDPVLVPCCGKSFEGSSIEKWLINNPICPLCKESIDWNNLVPNRVLKDLIEEINST